MKSGNGVDARCPVGGMKKITNCLRQRTADAFYAGKIPDSQISIKQEIMQQKRH